MLDHEIKAAQDKFVEAKLMGASSAEAADMAGYSPNTPPGQIEKSPRVRALIEKALLEHQMDENWLVGQYKTGMEQSLAEGAKDRDHNAHAQYLKNLGFLMGYGNKSGPSVAVQINNNPGERESAEPCPTSELVAEVGALVKVLKDQIGSAGSGGVHADGAGAADSGACAGVVEPAQEPEASGGGGGA